MSRIGRVIGVGLIALAVGRSAAAGGGSFDQGVFRFRVAIDDSVAAGGVAKANAAFQSASNLLLAITGGKHVFGDVLVCSSSPTQQAEFLLTKKFRTRPTFGGYGKAGQYVILNTGDLADPAIGAALIVHEFAHHAYGLHDEYVGPLPQDVAGPWDPSQPPFHDDDPEHAYNWDLANCINDFLALPPAKQTPSKAPLFSCLTSLTAGHQTGQPMCIMENFLCAAGYGATNYALCDDTNHEPPGNPGQSWQQYVHGASCRATIQAGPYPLSSTFHPQASDFQWLPTGDARRYVLVIDHSGSMAGEPLELAKKGAKIFVNPMQPDDEIAVVAFSSEATPLFPLTTMTETQKKVAKQAIDPLTSDGGTDIGAGLAAGLDLLQASGSGFCNRAILLLSDGQAAEPTEVIAALKAEQIPVCTIAIGPSVDEELMQKIAAETGGAFLRVPDTTELASLFAKHAAWIKQQGVVADKHGLLLDTQTKTINVTVDASTRTASFIVSWDGAATAVAVALESPDDHIYSVGSSKDVQIFEDDASKSFVVSGKAAVPGQWTIELLNQTSEIIQFDVVGLSDNPFVQFAAGSDQQKYAWPQPMKVTATARFGAPLTGIKVDGVVSRPDGSQAEITLHDDGSNASGDERAKDGVYSAWFSSWNKAGAYTVQLEARVDDSADRLAAEGFGALPTQELAVESFQRLTEFSVLTSGVPVPSPHNLAVKSLTLDVHSSFPVENSLTIIGNIDIDPWSVNPKVDPLTLRVGNAQYTVKASDLLKIGDKDHYVFDTGPNGVSGFIDLFKKGSSLGKFKLADPSLPANAIGSLSPIDCRLTYAALDESVTIETTIGPDLASATFTSTDATLSPLFFVTSALVELKANKSGKDKLSLRARIGGDYAPAAAATLLRFGSYTLAIAPTAWDKDGQSFCFESAGATGSVSVEYDGEHQELSFRGSKLDLTGFSSPLTVEFGSASLHESEEILLHPQTSAGKTTYVY